MSPLRIAAWAMAGALLVAAATRALYPLNSTLAIEFDDDPPARVVAGVYPAERTPDGLTFAWTRGTFGVLLPGLDRTVPWTVTIRLAAARPDGATPRVTAAVDSVVEAQGELTAGFAERTLTIAPRADRARGASLALSVSPTFVPGPGDPRDLGAQVDWIRVVPAGRFPGSPAPWLPPMLLGLFVGAAIGALSLPWRIAASLIGAAAFAIGLTLTRGLSPFLPIALWPIAVAAGLTTAAVAFALPRSAVGARTVAGLTLLAVLIKLLILFRPDMPVGDTLFHAHRFQDVLAGKYVFASLAPGNYRFPYPIGLYVAAWPFAGLTGRTFDNMALLRVIVVSAEAFAAALLYRLIVRWRPGDEIAGAASVGIYHLLPLAFGVVATANLTNAFAQSLAMIALVATSAVAASAVAGEPARRLAVLAAGLTAIVLAAFLSHTSTFAVLTGQLGLTGLAFLLSRAPAWRRLGVTLLVVLAASLVVAFAVYYRHFMDIYGEAFARITAETGRATEAAGGRTPSARLADVPRAFVVCYGIPALLLGVAGGVRVARRDWAAPARLVLSMWLAACGGFLVIGIVTPVDLRHFLAALPIVAILAAVGLAEGWRAGGVRRTLAALAAVGIVWVAMK